MISVLIETKDDEEGLARTLSTLIGGAVEGVVREVIVCDRGSTDQTHKVAEHAGCVFISGTASAGARQAKGDWLLLLEPGARLVDGWIESAASHTRKATIAARFTRSRAHRSPFLSRVFPGNRALTEGLLIRKSQAVSLSRSGQDAEAIGRGLATKRLEGEIIVAPTK
ncbi:MAG: glycosyl transferase family 2 [Rhizobiaceae bacterium]